MRKRKERSFNYKLFNISIFNRYYHHASQAQNDITRKNLADYKKDPYSFKCHQRILVAFLMTLWALTLRTMKGYCWEIGFWKVAYSAISFIVFSIILALGTYWISKIYNPKNYDSKNIINKLCLIFMSIASLSWFCARYFKKKLKTNNCREAKRYKRDKMTQFIVYLNRFNLLFSFLFAVIVYFAPIDDNVSFFMVFAVLRTLSRSFEITIAFGKDILEKDKDSALMPHERLILAFSSLFECMINYSVVYYLVGFFDEIMVCRWQSFVYSFQSGLFFSNDFLKMGLDSMSPTALSMLQMTQVVTCMTLVFLAFASYMSNFTSGGGKDSES